MAMPQRKVSSWQRKVDLMHELALDLGYFCTSAVSYKVDLASTIASSIRPRSGTSVYQSVAISLPNVPLEFARQTFFFATQEPDIVLGTTTWNVPMMDQTSAVFGFIFQDASPSCTGASKAFKTPSEPVVRVIATILPGAIFSHVVNKRGMSKLYINFTYALVDETGEVHPPKDENRNEIALTPQEVHEIRAQVLSDAAAFSQSDTPLSAAWLRQLGDEEKAQITEAMVHNLTTAPAPPLGKRKPRADHYQIEAIVEERRGWFLIRWAG